MVNVSPAEQSFLLGENSVHVFGLHNLQEVFCFAGEFKGEVIVQTGELVCERGQIVCLRLNAGEFL